MKKKLLIVALVLFCGIYITFLPLMNYLNPITTPIMVINSTRYIKKYGIDAKLSGTNKFFEPLEFSTWFYLNENPDIQFAVYSSLYNFEVVGNDYMKRVYPFIAKREIKKILSSAFDNKASYSLDYDFDIFWKKNDLYSTKLADMDLNDFKGATNNCSIRYYFKPEDVEYFNLCELCEFVRNNKWYFDNTIYTITFVINDGKNYREVVVPTEVIKNNESMEEFVKEML